jgi:hypothetical protein
MLRLRPLIHALLCLALVLTGGTMASARHAPGLAGFAELCLSGGTELVAVDATGAPVAPHHVCPDCVAAFALAHLPAPDALLLAPGPARAAAPVAARSADPAPPRALRPPPRAPPSSV